MRGIARTATEWAMAFAVLVMLHLTVLGLPYYWDEAGYYIPATLDFYRSWRLIPQSTLPTGHTPLVMVYLGLTWHVFGVSPEVTRLAMLALAAVTLTVVYRLGARLAGREVGLVSAALLAVMPVFFAQSSLAHLDLAAGLFTMLAVRALLLRQHGWFALAASLAVLSKETAIVLLPVAWVYAWFIAKERRGSAWLRLMVPLLPLLAWTFYYHHVTGFWTGNREYLDYNFYTTLNPARILLGLLRRLYQVFVGGFNWVSVIGALFGIVWSRKHPRPAEPPSPSALFSQFRLIVITLTGVYLLFLSVVGGAVLRRYLLAFLPLLIILAVAYVYRLPKGRARITCTVAGLGFVASWFINPPYPFPFEDNLAYADFVRLHQQAAAYLEAHHGHRRILTVWPATDELQRPFLGYVTEPLTVAPIEDFRKDDFAPLPAESFDVLYLYSRQWQPRRNFLVTMPLLLAWQRKYFRYEPPVSAEELESRFGLRLRAEFVRRGQWVRIYTRSDRSSALPGPKSCGCGTPDSARPGGISRQT